jgi:polyhydroxyalkanoate synthesis regulator phasin
MPKKQNAESQKEQSERFKREAQKLIDAGELNPTEADEKVERLLTGVRPAKGRA